MFLAKTVEVERLVALPSSDPFNSCAQDHFRTAEGGSKYFLIRLWSG
jgi:hypothetical protein